MAAVQTIELKATLAQFNESSWNCVLW